MSKVMETVDQLRKEARELQKRIEASMAKTHDEIRGDLQESRAQAQRLAASLKQTAADARADARQHLEHAAAVLKAESAGDERLATATNADLRTSASAMLQRTREALQNISQAVAAKRAAAKNHAKT